MDLIKTAPDVVRPFCPTCHTDTYVTPIRYGLIDAPKLIFIEDGQESQEEFARETYSCIVEDADWNCARCEIRF